MPITLTTPVAPPTIASVNLVDVNINFRDLTVTFVYEQTDQAGAMTVAQKAMTGAAYQAAFVAASGNLKARNYAILQGLVPTFAGTVT